MNNHYGPESTGSTSQELSWGSEARIAVDGGWVGPPKISYWRIAWGHKLILFLFLLVGALAATTYVILQTPEYSASSTVELVGFNQSFMNMNQVDPQAGTDMTTASASNIQTQTRILTS